MRFFFNYILLRDIIQQGIEEVHDHIKISLLLSCLTPAWLLLTQMNEYDRGTQLVRVTNVFINYTFIRFPGGWCNNPTAVGFVSAFKKLVARAGACPSGKTGNVQQDSTELVMAATNAYVAPNNVRYSHEDDQRQVGEEIKLVAVNNISREMVNDSPVIENILVYISGFVVRKVMGELSCEECAYQLISVTPSLTRSHL